jgi:hypothetical protein
LKSILSVEESLTNKAETQHGIDQCVEEALSSSGSHVETSTNSLLESHVEEFSSLLDTCGGVPHSYENGYVIESPSLSNSHVNDAGDFSESLINATLPVDYNHKEKTSVLSESHGDTVTLPSPECQGDATTSPIPDGYVESTISFLPESLDEPRGSPLSKNQVEEVSPELERCVNDALSPFQGSISNKDVLVEQVCKNALYCNWNVVVIRNILALEC